MNGIPFVLVLLLVTFLPLFDGKPADMTEALENIKLLRLGNIMSLCEFFCESGEARDSFPRSAETTKINPRIFCDLCDDETTTTVTATTTTAKSAVRPAAPPFSDLLPMDPSLLLGGGGNGGGPSNGNEPSIGNESS